MPTTKTTPAATGGQSQPSEIQRLLAQGTEVTFTDGSSARLVLHARAMAAIEDHYGSLDEYFAALRAATGGKLYHHLAYTFQVTLGIPESKVWELIDTRQTMAYMAAIGNAINEAMPEAKAEDAQGNGTAAPEQSPGVASSTSPWSNGTSTPSASGR